MQLRRVGKTVFQAAVIGLATSSLVQAAPFTPGNVVAVRIGDGATPLVSGNFAGFIDEYTPTGTFVQSVPLPTSGGGVVSFNPNATTEHTLKLSSNGQYLTLPAYRKANGAAGSPASDTAVVTPRVIVRLDMAGNVDTSTAITDAYSGLSFRGVASTDGTQFWMSGESATGNPGGIRYVSSLGASTSTQVQDRNLRSVAVADGKLFYAAGAGTPRGVLGFSTLPTGAATPDINVTNIAGTTNAFQDLIALDVSPTAAGVDTIYTIQTATSAGTPTATPALQKFESTDGGLTWVARGSVATSGQQDFTAAVTLTGVDVFATPITANAPTSIFKLSDLSGFGNDITGSFTNIATSGANTTFRGLAVIPVPEPSIAGAAGFFTLGVLARRRRR